MRPARRLRNVCRRRVRPRLLHAVHAGREPVPPRRRLRHQRGQPFQGGKVAFSLHSRGQGGARVLSRGCRRVPCRTASQVLIAGMGGEEIVKILREGGFLPAALVLQPMRPTRARCAPSCWNKGYCHRARLHLFYDGPKLYDLLRGSRLARGGGAQLTGSRELEFGYDNIHAPSPDFRSVFAGGGDAQAPAARLAKADAKAAPPCRNACGGMDGGIACSLREVYEAYRRALSQKIERRLHRPDVRRARQQRHPASTAARRGHGAQCSRSICPWRPSRRRRRRGITCIVTHHPAIFFPVSSNMRQERRARRAAAAGGVGAASASSPCT